MTLGLVADYYFVVCRAFRKAYKWPPQIVDDLDLRRMKKILEETFEDNEREGNEISESTQSFEGLGVKGL